jgi:phosphotransferase system HPr (HPr) family protein
VTAAIEREFVVANELGFHARPAGEFVRAASRFEAEVEVSRGDEWVSALSVLSLLSLAASQGTKLRLRASGPDAEQAVAILGALIERQNAPD